ncbi:MAG: glycosyltransferase family 2 protein [Anaplasmataceae bacterium]|nr:glycosyltransferase family 2 protein [Anaplasmataceae bacterium]
MNDPKPLVSIILPTFNRSQLIGKSIQGVVDQAYSNWELIIIDDASTDSTPQILADWAKKDSRLRVIRNNQNNYPDISKNLNIGITEAKGKYIARLDDDDVWVDPQKLEKQVDFLENHPDYVIVGSGVIVVDEKGKELFRYTKKENDIDIRNYIYHANPFSHTTVLFRKDAALKVGGYGKSPQAEDWEFWLRLGQVGKMHNLPTHSTQFLMAGQNKTLQHQRAQARAIISYLWSHRGKYPRFWSGFLLNTFQYFYSFLPVLIRKPLHTFLVSIKRKKF